MHPTRRFSDRVADYVKYRPSYPNQIINDLGAAGILTPASVVADVGSGTGLLARLFLENGNRVLGVEPNPEMRAAGAAELAGYGAAFTSVDGAAEATTLPAASVDVITAGQALHWFDRARAGTEFRRILRPPGWVVLVWNERLTDATPFLADYEALLRAWATDYAKVDHRNTDEAGVAEFFAPGRVELRKYRNEQSFDLEGLRGRLLSSSYTPPPGNARHAPMLAALAALFERHQQGGRVSLLYETNAYAGTLAPPNAER